MPSIGFIILINPRSPLEQSERLIRKLNRMFDHPPITCHQDFGQNPMELRGLTSNVRVVTPYVATKWADFSCIEAAVKALRLLYTEKKSPDWFVYLSGADYPIKTAEHILKELQSTNFDAHIEHILAQRKAPQHLPHERRLEGHKGIDWPRLCHRRYCSICIRVPWVTKSIQFKTRNIYLESPVFTAARIPFTTSFQCYAGEAWFCANRRAAEAILDSYTNNTNLVSHYRKVLCPEESYFHTVLANAPGLRLSQDPLRYMDWTGGGNHPKVLSVDDLPKLGKTHAHFARKIPEKISPEMLQGLEYLSQ